jgi:hypothetical protein
LSEAQKRRVKAGAISSATVFKSLGVKPSGPQALLGLRFSSSFFTPSFVMMMSSQKG